MKKCRKQVLSIVSMILALAMICTAMPISVIADSTLPDYSTPQAAQNTGDGGTTDGGKTLASTKGDSVVPDADSGKGETVLSSGAKGGGGGGVAFVPPVGSLSASAWQMKLGGDGSISIEQVTNTEWNSTSNSGIRFFYTLADKGGNIFSNNISGCCNSSRSHKSFFIHHSIYIINNNNWCITCH